MLKVEELVGISGSLGYDVGGRSRVEEWEGLEWIFLQRSLGGGILGVRKVDLRRRRGSSVGFSSRGGGRDFCLFRFAC